MNKLKGFRRYWNRKEGYVRLNGSGLRRNKNRRRVESAKFGSEQPNKNRRFWGVRISRKLKVLLKKRSIILLPIKILKGIRDSYVNMMLGLANSTVFSSGFGGVGAEFPGVAGNGYGFSKPALKEYDEKVIVDFYRKLMEQGSLKPRDAVKIVNDGGIVLCQRPLP